MYVVIVALFLLSVLLLICGTVGRHRHDERENCWPGLSCNDCPNPCGDTKKEKKL